MAPSLPPRHSGTQVENIDLKPLCSKHLKQVHVTATPSMKGPQLLITVDDEVTTVVKHKPYRVPKLWQAMVREGLDVYVQMGIIPVIRPTT